MIDFSKLLPPPAADLLIRPWLPADCARVVEVVRAIGSEFLGKDLHHWDTVYEAPSGMLWTAELGGRAIGFGCSGMVGQDSVLFHSDLVDPAVQRRGVGSALALVRLATLDADEVREIGLEATVHSRAFYERFGFCASDEVHQDVVSKIELRWMRLAFSEAVADAAFRALSDSGVKWPLAVVAG